MIEARKLCKFYEMGDSIVHALDGVDLDIDEGEFVSIAGPSGSGKSTLMHILGCLDRPTTGSYKFKGLRVGDFNSKQLARVRNEEIGFVFQTFNLINRTSAIDNVALPLIYGRKGDSSKLAHIALERVGMAYRAKHKPSELSGGERQRVAIARAIVNNPSLIFADEPTGNLDSRSGEQIMQIFHDLHASGVTVILVTHEVEIAAQAQRLIRMHDGKIVEDRPVDDSQRRTLMTEPAAHSSARARAGDQGAESVVKV